MIHAYQLNGYNIVLDVYSGSVHLVDEVALDAIVLGETQPRRQAIPALLEKYAGRADVTRAALEECFDDIEALQRQGKLYAPDVYAGRADAFKNRRHTVKALCLHVAHACNLNCEYCFAAQGKFHGQDALMPFETGKRALDFLIEQSGGHKNLEVDFFGGEPLMIWEVCKRLVQYARSVEKEADKRFRFTLTTNGLLIDDDVIDFVNREMHNVVLSLDGRREIHDQKRRTPAGGGSYDLVLPKFKKLVEARGGKGYYMRGTFTHQNPDFAADVLHMADLGFTELSMEPVVCPPGAPYALTQEDLPVILEQYEKLAVEMLRREREGRPITFYHYMLDLAHGPCIYKRIAGCGSGTEYLAVTPWGDLYPCHQFVGEEQFRLGDVWQGVTAPERQQPFRACNAFARPECAGCWAKLYCSGGCAANAWHASGDILGVYEYGCTLFRKRIECAIMMQAARAARPELRPQSAGV